MRLKSNYQHLARTAVAAAILHAGVANAQTADAGNGIENTKGPTLNLDSVVVTGTSIATSKMKSSVAVSSVDADQIALNQPQNAADVLSAIPGLFVQSSGGGGNANVTVRGLPITAGGSRYLQFQEDGLPVVLFGDIAFGNPDDFIRMDTSVDHVEALRGGTGSTLSTNGPGGIVNFISKTGDEQGGSVGLTTGLGFQDNRYDFSYGGKLDAKTRFFIGGYYESGEGPRIDSATALQGGQIKGNITHDFDIGYVRLNFKHLDDQQPMYMPAPVRISGGSINTIPGIDPRTYTGYSPFMPTDQVLNNNNTPSTINLNNGMSSTANALGLETHLRLNDGWVLDDKFRIASNSGQWAAFFPGSAVAAAPADAVYANGPSAGKAYAGLALTNVVFDVNVKDLGNTVNDAKLTQVFDNLYGGRLTAGAGLFTDTQHVDLVWNFNSYLTSAASTPMPLNSATAGASGNGFQGPAFGLCCARDIEASYQTTAPYVFGTYEIGSWTLDGSVRQDNQKASGYYNQGVASSTSPTGSAYVQANQVPIDYSLSHTEYSLGANFALNKNVAFFGRYSEGASFNADRIMFNGPLSGSAHVPLNVVKQLEAGMKARYGALSTFVTFFDARTSEYNYSATTQNAGAGVYDGKGVEIEAGYRMGDFHLSAGLTYTDSNTVSYTGNTNQVGQPTNRQPKFMYQFGPGYTTDRLDVGLNIQGVGSATETDNVAPNNTLPAYTVVNGHFAYNFNPQTSLMIGVYNLFNTLAYTELDGTTSARALNGRTAKASLKYSF